MGWSVSLKMPKISIIVPVFNAAKYLGQCIQSIQSQTYSDFELLLIDDGSTDLSGEICDFFAGKDERIKVYHKDNSGVSATRNFGIDKALGEYIGFADADDQLEPDTLKLAMEKLTISACEVVVFGYGIYSETKTGTICKSAEVVNDIPKLAGYVWNKLYSKNLIGKVRFDESLKLFEDEEFNSRVLCSTDKISYVKSPLYKYYYRNESASNNIFIQQFVPLMKLALDWRLRLISHLSLKGKSYFEDINVLNLNYIMAILSNIFSPYRNEGLSTIMKEAKQFIEEEKTQKLAFLLKEVKVSNKNLIILCMVRNKMLFGITCLYGLKIIKMRSKL